MDQTLVKWTDGLQCAYVHETDDIPTHPLLRRRQSVIEEKAKLTTYENFSFHVL